MQISTINMYKFIKTMYDILTQCIVNYMGMKKKSIICLRLTFQIRNSSQHFLGVLRSAFSGFGCPKRHPDALLAKTMAKEYRKLSGPIIIFVFLALPRVYSRDLPRTHPACLLDSQFLENQCYPMNTNI